MSAKKPASAIEIRNWARANLSAIPEAGQKCLGSNARGRLHPETVKAFLKPKSHAEKMALRAHPPVAAIVKRLEDEKIAKAAGASKVNAAELLGTL